MNLYLRFCFLAEAVLVLMFLVNDLINVQITKYEYYYSVS